MTLPSIFRSLQGDLDDLGLQVIKMRQSKHLVLRLKNRHGAIRSLTVPVSPSDRRSHLNTRTLLRRIAEVRDEETS